MAARAEQIADEVLGLAHHPLADQPIVRVGALRRQATEPLHQSESDPMLTAAQVEGPYAPERPQLVLDIVKALRNLERLCPCCADFRVGHTPGIHQRCAQCGMELHLPARVPVRSACQSGERPLHAAAALVKQRQLHPHGHRGRSLGRKDPGKNRETAQKLLLTLG
jgi:hypothetical protein